MSRTMAVEPRLGLAIAALILGILSFLLSFILIGAVLGVVGLVLALVHLARPFQPRGMAVAGLLLSILGIVASVGFGMLYLSALRSLDQEGASSAGHALEVWEGVRAPDFTVTTLDGETITLSELAGRRVVVDFWATWCGPCVREVPHFNRLRAEVPTEELVLVGISGEDPSLIGPFLEEHGVTYPSVSASELPEPYSDVHIIPTTFFIDRNGVIQSVVTGYSEYDVLLDHALGPDYEGEVRMRPEEEAEATAPAA